ncbi:MAG: hypothetical protein U5K99_09845 [Anaerolineales bacterium]|nr:hypothetical protein [Anaerolineales bacterium]
MTRKALFPGLVVDEYDRAVETTYVGDDPCYVVDDDGFKRHIPSEKVDKQVLEALRESIQGHEEYLSEQAAKMLGQDDIFSRAMLTEQLKNIDQQFEQVLETGIPEESRTYMGMTGFKIIIDHHGSVIKIEQPGGSAPEM